MTFKLGFWLRHRDYRGRWAFPKFVRSAPWREPLFWQDNLWCYLLRCWHKLAGHHYSRVIGEKRRFCFGCQKWEGT